MGTLLDYLKVLGISLIPVLELRAAVPWGIAHGLPLTWVFLVSVIGNMIPVPFIIYFIRPVFAWMKKKKWLKSIVDWLEARAHNKHELIVKYEILGLLLLVAIPLPGTGAWTGALVASLFDLRLKNAVPVIFAGVVIAGLITTAVTYGVAALF